MIAEPFAVIAGHDDERRRGAARAASSSSGASAASVAATSPSYGRAGILRVERRRRLMRRVRIEEVHPRRTTRFARRALRAS